MVLRGLLRVEHEAGAIDVRAGQAIVAEPGEWIRYSSPEPGGAEYVGSACPHSPPTPSTAIRHDLVRPGRPAPAARIGCPEDRGAAGAVAPAVAASRRAGWRIMH